jgi:hypothetical protein
MRGDVGADDEAAEIEDDERPIRSPLRGRQLRLRQAPCAEQGAGHEKSTDGCHGFPHRPAPVGVDIAQGSAQGLLLPRAAG